MARNASPSGADARGASNDDIGEAMRLQLYRTQLIIREAELKAFELFLQSLVKGTSHLSIGQEAIAAGFASAMRPDLSFCTYRGHAHTPGARRHHRESAGRTSTATTELMRGKEARCT
ncbi:MAG: hypothetical protein R3D62_08855 [Xanthobacteraceae bacterium]